MRFSQSSSGAVVRNATGDDVVALEALYRALVPRAAISVSKERVQAIADDPNNLLLVIDVEEAVAGSAFITFCMDAMFGDRPFAVVENIIVDPKSRSKGAGRALLAAIDEAALKRDCSKIMLLSSAKRIEAHRFFEANGFDGDAKRGFVKYCRSVE